MPENDETVEQKEQIKVTLLEPFSKEETVSWSRHTYQSWPCLHDFNRAIVTIESQAATIEELRREQELAVDSWMEEIHEHTTLREKVEWERDELQAVLNDDQRILMSDYIGKSLQELAAELSTLREKVRRMLGISEPWPAINVLSELADAAEHLLNCHSCNCDGHEKISHAKDSARILVRRIEVEGACLFIETEPEGASERGGGKAGSDAPLSDSLEGLNGQKPSSNVSGQKPSPPTCWTCGDETTHPYDSESGRRWARHLADKSLADNDCARNSPTLEAPTCSNCGEGLCPTYEPIMGPGECQHDDPAVTIGGSGLAHHTNGTPANDKCEQPPVCLNCGQGIRAVMTINAGPGHYHLDDTSLASTKTDPTACKRKRCECSRCKTHEVDCDCFFTCKGTGWITPKHRVSDHVPTASIPREPQHERRKNKW